MVLIQKDFVLFCLILIFVFNIDVVENLSLKKNKIKNIIINLFLMKIDFTVFNYGLLCMNYFTKWLFMGVILYF